MARTNQDTWEIISRKKEENLIITQKKIRRTELDECKAEVGEEWKEKEVNNG